MSFKNVRTGGDVVRFRCAVRIECTDCFATRTMTGFEWIQACGTKSLEAAQRRLKCRRCGAKKAKMVVLSPVE
jgi:hypothetical protein